jgi:hypothetical protein
MRVLKILGLILLSSPAELLEAPFWVATEHWIQQQCWFEEKEELNHPWSRMHHEENFCRQQWHLTWALQNLGTKANLGALLVQ